ncbi:MAG TPA: glucans biosynthesis glucosyltransferase MdoH [Opitutaceae bacterium]|jgi:membrane glycosyltransferase|nr:glucans biosynthesis glucosyltransferase MdoH [Opitutaceae bacterium]HOR25224.1 glucans biosynthesis glucosyltransferase MdoH [Opitutaceae bacterium]HPK49640.1 glucans biosynthesis glucosyltransferase MdoH [Opitutaceae bacterium]
MTATCVFDPSKMTPRRLMRRRFMFFTAVFSFTSLATWVMADLLWRVGSFGALEVSLLVLFVVLFAHISVGFCTAMFGLYVINRGGDRCRITQTVDWNKDTPLGRTAILVPVFNEDVSRVFEGLRVIYGSLKDTGKLEHFDFFILSDSNRPTQWIQEEVAWTELCKQVGGFGRIFYRKRRQQINKKSGNVADFLRRWGKDYRYMVVFDADSIMTGRSLVQLVAMMESNPHAGIIQTAPRLARGESLYARIQAFSNRLYSPLFLAGTNYWQQHEGNYWGHNAVIRVQPFIDHCALPDLPGSEPFGGRILSHDFVEAALMRKAGWTVWLAHDVEGTYEEGPPTLIDSAKRDRRWCQGNMQHTWLLLARGFRPANRFHLLMGVMGYVSSPLWLLFLILSTGMVISQVVGHDIPFDRPEDYTSLFGYRVYVPEAFFLFLLTLLLLFLPKIVSVILTMADKASAQSFGGRPRLFLSALLEIVTSSLLAPINMLFNSKFVLFTVLGQGVGWVTQQRQAAADGTDWREAILTHWPHMAVGLVWGASAFALSPMFFWWMLPVVLGLLLSIPISIFLSKGGIGLKSREMGLFLTPDETQPPAELTLLEKNLSECYQHMQPIEPLRADYGLLQAVLDPYVNAVHVSLLRQRRPSEESREWFTELRGRLLRDGPAQLSQKEKMALLLDAESMIWLHEELWRQPGEALAEWWRLAMRQYNVLTTHPVTALYR